MTINPKSIEAAAKAIAVERFLHNAHENGASEEALKTLRTSAIKAIENLWYDGSDLSQTQAARYSREAVAVFAAERTQGRDWQAIEKLLDAGTHAIVPLEPTKKMIYAANWSMDKARERDGKMQEKRPYTYDQKHTIRYQAMVRAAMRKG